MVFLQDTKTSIEAMNTIIKMFWGEREWMAQVSQGFSGVLITL